MDSFFYDQDFYFLFFKNVRSLREQVILRLEYNTRTSSFVLYQIFSVWPIRKEQTQWPYLIYVNQLWFFVSYLLRCTLWDDRSNAPPELKLALRENQISPLPPVEWKSTKLLFICLKFLILFCLLLYYHIIKSVFSRFSIENHSFLFFSDI